MSLFNPVNDFNAINPFSDDFGSFKETSLNPFGSGGPLGGGNPFAEMLRGNPLEALNPVNHFNMAKDHLTSLPNTLSKFNPLKPNETLSKLAPPNPLASIDPLGMTNPLNALDPTKLPGMPNLSGVGIGGVPLFAGVPGTPGAPDISNIVQALQGGGGPISPTLSNAAAASVAPPAPVTPPAPVMAQPTPATAPTPASPAASIPGITQNDNPWAKMASAPAPGNAMMNAIFSGPSYDSPMGRR